MTFYKDQPIKILKAEIIEDTGVHNSFQPGEIIFADKNNGIVIKAKQGRLRLIRLQRQNKKALPYKDFLNGMQLSVKEKFQNAKN